MDARIQKIRANGTAATIESFERLPHGFGLGTGTGTAGLLDNAVKFWEQNIGRSG